METVLTLEKLQPILEDLRDQIKSTVRGAVTVLRNEFQREFSGIKDEISGIKRDIAQLQMVVSEHTRMIRENGEGIRELKEEMHAMEGRLTEKIDGNTRRLDDYDHLNGQT